MNRRQRLCRAILLRILGGLEQGELVLRDAEGERSLGRVTTECPLRAVIEVSDGAFWPAAVMEQSAGVGRAWAEGWWTSDDPVAVLRILSRNEPVLRRWTGPTVGLLAPWHRLLLWLRRNTRNGARRNIAEHYDLGNAFFATFLDATMTYSCALFDRPGLDLETAQRAKLDAVCRKLDLGPDDHVLEIGTGWGSFALHAAGEYGCRVTTTTLSAEQARLAGERVRRAGLEDRIEILQTDYRDLQGRYDKLVSIEMIEAVGVKWYPTFFRRCAELIRDDGALLLQAIVVDDRHFAHDARHVDFIKKHIFPGGVLPSLRVIAETVADHTDLQTAHLEDLTADYARTLRLWRENLYDAWDGLLAAGRDERFLRLWEFYFLYCEGGFRERRIGDVQLLLVKPACRDLRLVSTPQEPLKLHLARRAEEATE